MTNAEGVFRQLSNLLPVFYLHLNGTNIILLDECLLVSTHAFSVEHTTRVGFTFQAIGAGSNLTFSCHFRIG